MPDVLIASALGSLPAATHGAAPLTVFLQALVLVAFVGAVTRIAGRIAAHWQRQRLVRHVQIAGLWLCAAALAVMVASTLALRSERGVTLLSATALLATAMAMLIAFFTMPLAWRGAWRLLQREGTDAPIRIHVPAAYVAVLCLLSLAAAIAIGWIGRHAALPYPYPALQLTFCASFLLTLRPSLRWLGHRLRPTPAV